MVAYLLWHLFWKREVVQQGYQWLSGDASVELVLQVARLYWG